jgi:hypothetical protein
MKRTADESYGNVAEDKTVFADERPGFGLGASVDGSELADDRAGADATIRPLASEVKILRQVADDRPGVNLAAFADLRPTGKIRVGIDFHIRANLDRAIHDNVRADIRSGIDLRLFINDGGRMNGHFDGVLLIPIKKPTAVGF